MSTSQATSFPLSSTPNYHPIFEKALREYKKKTNKEISTHPLAEEINGCSTIGAILTVLQGKANELNQSQSSDERLTKWLTPTINVLNALSSTLGEGVGTVFPPTKIIFSAMSILLVAAKGTAASRDVLIELFDRIENFFVRLQTHTDVPPTAQMTNVMGKVMAEVLSMLAVATKVMHQSRKRTFLKQLVGRNDIEDALVRLDKLEQGELRIVSAQVLKTASDLKDATSDIKDDTGNIMNDTRETKVMVQQIVDDVFSREWERLRGWLTPPDPSTNHTNACSAQHERTAAWVFNEDIFKEWESFESGSLLWIHGKAGSGKSILCSAIIQHLITLRDAGSASVAYFYFDFRDRAKKDLRNLISSLLIQLSSRSKPCLDLLSHVYSTYNDGREWPTERSLVQCLKDMLMALSLSQLPTYIILDALDECPNTSGIPTPRGHVLGLVTDLVDLRLANLHICITSRPESDIWTALKPLISGQFSLHDQHGQKRDIAEYISSTVQTDPQMKRWREDDRKLVIDKLSEKADGMFRWVFCQLEMLRHCLAPSLRRQLNELPKSLDETYERVLKEIESTNQGRHARRLLQCLATAMRPLCVEELAEVLAFDLDGAKAEIPRFHVEWRWEDQEQAVLSACSSLISIVGGDDSRVVQFSHFSVKEYLTSDRLSATSGDVSRYHIVPEPAHLILAQACLGVLLNSDDRVVKESKEGSGKNRAETIPLLKYAAEYWASHAQVGNVPSHLKGAMERLFDLDKPYFFEWRQIHDIYPTTLWDDYRPTNPLYYAALCGFYCLVQCLIAKYPDQVNHDGSQYNSPLTAALFRKHVRVANLLLEHGAHAHVRGNPPLCYAIEFSDNARVHAVQFLLTHGAHVNAGQNSLRTPLHLAADVGDSEVARILLEHGADVDLRDNYGQVPLHLVSTSKHEFRRDEGGERSIVAQLLVEHCADVNARNKNGTTPLHSASYHWRFEIARLLLKHGANANALNVQGRNPMHELSRRNPIYSYADRPRERPSGVKLQNVLGVANLLLEYGVDVNALDKDHSTPLHFASSYGVLELARILLDHGAKADAENALGQTPLHLASQNESFSCEDANIARLLLELGADVNARDRDSATPLHFAYSHGNFEIALVLLDHGAEVNAQNIDGQTPLHLVPRSSSLPANDNPRVAQLILERGAGVNSRDKDQATPLHLACSMSMFKTAQVLLDHGAEADARNSKGQTPLHRVSQNPGTYNPGSDDYCIARLLLEHGMDVNARDNDLETPLHIACSHGDHRTALVLLDHGAEVSTQNADGQTPLHRVSQSSNSYVRGHVARLLLERGADINARDKHQATPLHLASYKSRSEIVEVLLDHGAEADARNADGQTPLHRVSQCPHHYGFHSSRVARLLLGRDVDVNTRDKEQETPLLLASHYGRVEVAEALLDHEAWVNAEDIHGQTPLHQVLLGYHNYQSFTIRTGPQTLEGDPGKAVRFAGRLLERGADVNARNKDHETPLHLASRLQLHEMARLLLKHGADVDVKNSEGKSPLQIASGRKGRGMKRLLSKYSTK